ncbi:hypothetical protein BD413DRAFT_609896 [Trametes elegans]|nr:hypothetical protein BD413DRAFT_609896 [Trametes elegans]
MATLYATAVASNLILARTIAASPMPESGGTRLNWTEFSGVALNYPVYLGHVGQSFSSAPSPHWQAQVNPCTEAFHTHVIHDNIFSHCSPVAILRLSRVNRSFHRAVQDYSERAFNINKRLLRFFSNPLAFRSLQARTATVISGSFALQFFDRSYYPGSDLDVYCHPKSAAILDVGSFLLSEGYVYQPYAWQLPEFRTEVENTITSITSLVPIENLDDDAEDVDELVQLYSVRSMRTVYCFTRAPDPTEPHSSAQTVQIIVPRSSPMAVLLDFHSTCVMNVITFNAAFAFYPLATLEQRVSLTLNEADPRTPAALAKYAARGWRTLANPSPLIPYLEPRAFQVNTPRWVCDSHSWTMRLSVEGSPAGVVLAPLDAAVGDEVVIDHGTVSTTVLRWQYTTGSEKYLSKLIGFLVQQGRVEHQKLPEGKKMEDCADIWTWWDEVLPVFRTRFCADQSAASKA